MSTPKQKIVLNVFVQLVYANWLNQFEVSWISMPLQDAIQHSFCYEYLVFVWLLLTHLDKYVKEDEVKKISSDNK